MDLFVINRYREDNQEDLNLIDRETKHLQELKQRIEERKKAHVTKKKSDIISLKPQVSVKSVESSRDSDYKENEQKIHGDLTINDRKDESHQINEVSSSTTDKKTDKPPPEFKVLGVNDFENKPKVQRFLPYWLSHPYSVPTNLHELSCKIENLEWLHPSLKSILLAEGVAHLFPVQEKVIPFILEEHRMTPPFWPHDICVSAPTGSGKTLSFVLPIVQILMNQIGRHIRALIVLPVQELAAQVAKVFRTYGSRVGLKIALMSGSTPLHQEQQQIVRYTESAGWTSEVDIIVCTAGRLVEHIQNTEGFSLKHLKFLVIDEADRIMDHIQNDWLYHMDKHIKLEQELMSGKVPSLNWISLTEQKTPPHKLLFSATLSQDPEKLDQWGLFQPKLFSAAPTNIFEEDENIRKYTTPDELEEEFSVCNPEEKPLVLYNFLVEKKWDKVLCFTNSAQSAHRLTVLMNIWGKGQLKVAELSAALNRSARDAVLKKFTQSEIDVLIGTDALARGIDIPNCNYVISYDPPRNIKTYIHRVGRTGRAGKKGRAATILLPNQVNVFKDLIQSGGKSQLQQVEIDSNIYNRLSQSYGEAIKETKNIIHNEISTKVEKSIELKRGFRSKPRKRKHEK